MKAFWALLKVSFKSLLLTSTNIGRGKRKAATGASALILISLLMLYLSGMYSFSMASIFAPMGGLDIMLMAIFIMAVAFPLVFTLFSGQSLLFSTKDADLVLSLPVSAFSVMLSRLMALYLEVLLMVELMLLPAGVVWLLYGGGGGALFLILLLFEGIFLAFLPTLFSLVFGCVISLLISRLRFKNLFTVLFSLLLVVAVMALSFTASFSMNDAAAMSALDVESLRATVMAAVPPAAWAAQAVTGPNLLYLLLIMAVCLLPFLGVTWLFSKIYKSLLTRLSSHALRSNYKLGKLGASGSFWALFKKEARKFFGTPAYLLNSGIMIILIIAACVYAVTQRGNIAGIVAMLAETNDISAIMQFIAPILLAILGFCLTTVYPAAVSISLEGNTLWILKEAPVSTRRIFAAKAGFNFALDAFASLVCIPLAGYAFALPAATIAAMLVVALLLGALLSMVNLYCNLRLPRMDAENETIVIKQSGSVFLSMLGGIVILTLFVVLYLVMNALGTGFLLYCLAASGLLLLLSAGMAVLLNTSGKRLFAEL